MTSQFNQHGAIDLSTLANKSAPAGDGNSSGQYVVDVTEANFDEVMRRSLQHPIVAEFTSPRASGAEALSATLDSLSTKAAGKWLLARINVDENMGIVQALGIQSAPMVVGVIGGQLAPLFEGVLPAEQVEAYIGELLKAAVANGITGTAQPTGPAPAEDTDEEAEQERDPRFDAADAAVEAGDFETARSEFDKLVQANPADSEAIQGRASAGLLARTMTLDGDQAMARAQAEPDSLEAQFAAADVELASGLSAEAFARLIALVRTRTGDEKDAVRLRLLELFETLPGDDPAVLSARRDLMTALF
ncbi:tetratricopeptide repeat protein [Propionibacteriaceae bacterium Y1685]|uniref:tetratricopeptide repeat protein n=1 Tax=Microlunatus sp. Y1700 TaxID=3418487 RepID=UPI003B7D695A